MAFNLGHGRWARLERLLDMMYRPAELASEIGISAESFHRTCVPAGAPIMKDAQNRVWINGKDFRNWARGNYASTPKGGRMGADEIYCMKCRARVKPAQVETQPHPRSPQLMMVFGRCPTCGRKVTRFQRGAK